MFLYWALCHTYELIVYRLTDLPPCLSDKFVLLLVDGHTSRLNADALALLAMPNVDVITFPERTSHLLQPFDVA